jgi:formamidopyrimidine-DNA glycosylase
VPELPEVETARALIAAKALRRRIVAVDDTDTFVCRPHAPGEIRAALLGRMLTVAHRRGKTMWCETSGVGRATTPGPELGIHLGMSGRIIVTSKHGAQAAGGDPFSGEPTLGSPQWNRFTIAFADGGGLALFDKRRLGRIRLDPDLTELGPDAAEVTRTEFRGLVMTGMVAVKARLLDQSKIAGVGNLLADEALWQAKLSPSAPVDTLAKREVDRLYRSLESSLTAAIKGGGVHTGEVIGFRRAGAQCPRCGAPMHHGKVGGRTTWWCSREQA